MLPFENIQVIAVTRCDKANLIAGQKMSFKPRPRHAFVYFLSGRCRYTYEKEGILLGEANTLVYLPQGEAYEVLPLEDCCCVVINFDALDPAPSPAFATVCRSAPKMKDCMLAAAGVYLRPQPGSGAQLCSLVYRAVSLLQKNWQQDYLTASQRGRLQPALAYLEQWVPKEEIHVSELAALCGMSQRYFGTLFFRYCQTSPKQYILRKKLDHAQMLLESTALPISTVAEESGFTSVYHFSRIFKRCTGMTPTSYRNISMY